LSTPVNFSTTKKFLLKNVIKFPSLLLLFELFFTHIYHRNTSILKYKKNAIKRIHYYNCTQMVEKSQVSRLVLRNYSWWLFCLAIFWVTWNAQYNIKAGLSAKWHGFLKRKKMHYFTFSTFLPSADDVYLVS
jgi:hypothetical protein